VSRGRPGTRRARKVVGVIIMVGVVGYGAVLLGLGISGFANVHTLATSGVPVVGRVSATGSAWADTIVGVIFLALVPLSFLYSLISAGRRRSSAVQAAPGP
jgi:TRAP-type C4-dicarboxylate transport system permease small subunit